MSYSNLLFDLVDLPPAINYEKLFENLPMLQENIHKTGRHSVSRNNLLKALIYKSLRRFPYLSDLTFELNNNPSISKALGFNPLAPAPSTERFSSFLHDTDHNELNLIQQLLVQELIKVGVISGNSIAIDSCPIVVSLRENNLKTSMADRFDKAKIPKGDPDARLGVLIHFPAPFKKEVRYFWGYRNHVINDIATELPIREVTKPANVPDTKVAKELIQEAISVFNLNIEVVTGDTNYDSEDLLRFIINDLKALAIIPHNPRNEQQKGYQIHGDKVICEAGLDMYHKGKMRPKKTGIFYCQFICPIIYDKQIQYQHIICPVLHPRFFKGKGCNVLIRMEPSIRSEIGYHTQLFKELYKKRTSVERCFSRLLAIAMQNPTIRGFNANCNHGTIAHILVLMVALSAYKTGQLDKIRFVKSFVPNFLLGNF
jgi:Transposase DDE domain